VSPVKYKLGFYIPEDILHSHRRENLKSYSIKEVKETARGQERAVETMKKKKKKMMMMMM
jgi:hypothetical protein